MYQFNPNTKMLHKKPATENCNLDDSEDEVLAWIVNGSPTITAKSGPIDFYSLCHYCFRSGEIPDFKEKDKDKEKTDAPANT